MFNSGLYANSRPQVDVGGAIDAATRGASTLIQNAYLRTQAERQRRLADEDRRLQLEDRQRGIEREEREEARATEELQFKRAQAGYVPPSTRETVEVEPGRVEAPKLFDGARAGGFEQPESSGLIGKAFQLGAERQAITAPRLTTGTEEVPASVDVTRTPQYRLGQQTRERKVASYENYIRTHPRLSKLYTTPEAIRSQAEVYTENPGLADNDTQERAPVMGSPEYLRALDAAESVRDRHERPRTEGAGDPDKLRRDYIRGRVEELTRGTRDPDTGEMGGQLTIAQAAAQALSDWPTVEAAYSGKAPVAATPAGKPQDPAVAADYARAAQLLQAAIDRGVPRATAQAAYDRAVMGIARKHGQVK